MDSAAASESIALLLRSGGFWAGILIGSLFGVLSGFIANMLYDKFKRKGKKHYINLSAEGDVIRIEGQLQNSPQGRTVLSGLFKKTFLEIKVDAG